VLNLCGIDDLLVRLSRALEAAEREPLRQAALTALAAMPPETLGPGSASMRHDDLAAAFSSASGHRRRGRERPLRRRRPRGARFQTALTAMSYWAALRTKTNCEARAELCLKAIGLDAYCPRARHVRIGRRGKRVTSIRPMFPNYLFILVTGQWRPALSIPSVSNAIKFGGAAAPSAVPNAVIEEIKRREAEIAVKHDPPRVTAGSIVKIKGGPLHDKLGLCTSVRATTVMVLISMFGHERKIRFSRAAVETV
jgi:transcription antitermination factor NusG